VKNNGKSISLSDLINGFLFSIQAEGKSPRTFQYYKDLLSTFSIFALNEGWSQNAKFVDATRIRSFLAWVGSRTHEYQVGNGTRLKTTVKPSTAYPYFRALRRLFNWAKKRVI
jgi:hypothetical protein